MKWSQALSSMLGLVIAATSVSAQQIGPLPDIPRGTIALHLHPLVTGISAPDYGINPPGDLSRLFVVEQRGLILVIENGVLEATPALDVQSRVSPPLNPNNANDERGLLGLAFSPGFNDPNHVGYRTLYTYSSEPIPPGTSPTYVAPNNATQNYRNLVIEYKMSASDPNVIDASTRREIISFGKNAGNHNGGTVAFGPDGYLYLALGDGGNANDVGASHIEPGGNAQNLSTPLGKMLRFDPINPSLTEGSADAISANGQYRIPATNPYAGGLVPEIYAIGLRNPYRFAFDRLTGELILADVGQNNIEEIDRITLGGNYGWAVKEGDFLFNRSDGTIGARSPGVPEGLIDPLLGPAGTLEYDHSDGISITGGFVYRGTAIPELVGKYVFGDLAIRNAPPRIDGRLFYADLASGEMAEFRLPLLVNDKVPNQLTVHGFGEDGHGELYAMVTNTPANGTGGIVYQLSPVIPIEFSLEPESIALSGQGSPKRVHAFLEPQPPYSASDIDVASIRLNNAIPVDETGPPAVIGDEDEDGIPDLKVYFSRTAIEMAFPAGDAVPVKVTGLLGTSVGFEGNDVVRIKGGDVTNPTANLILEPGSSYDVTYQVETTAPSVALAYSADGGATWSVQVSEAANTGTIVWTVPSQPTDQAIVAVVEVEQGQATSGEVDGVVGVSERFSISAGTVSVPGNRTITTLFAPRPNPSGGPVQVGFSLAKRGKVDVTVFDLQGRQVAGLADGLYEAGTTELSWDGRHVNGRKAESGLYFVRLRADGQEWRKRLIRLD